MSLKNFLRKANGVEQESGNDSKMNTLLKSGKLEKTKLDLTHALSLYERSSKNKHDAWEKYIEQLIASGGHIDDDTAWKMINSGEEELLVYKLKKCRGLGFHTANHLMKNYVDSVLECMHILNYGVIKKGEKEPNYTKISVFGFDEDDYKRVISYCISSGRGDHVMCHINDFYTEEQIYDENPVIYNFTLRGAEPMFDVSYIEKILWELSGRSDNMYYWMSNLRELQKYYHGLINPEIALKLIEKGNKDVIEHIAEEVSLFRPNKKLIFELAEMGYGGKIKAEGISGFEGEEYKEIVHFLADHGVKL